MGLQGELKAAVIVPDIRDQRFLADMIDNLFRRDMGPMPVSYWKNYWFGRLIDAYHHVESSCESYERTEENRKKMGTVSVVTTILIGVLLAKLLDFLGSHQEPTFIQLTFVLTFVDLAVLAYFSVQSVGLTGVYDLKGLRMWVTAILTMESGVLWYLMAAPQTHVAGTTKALLFLGTLLFIFAFTIYFPWKERVRQINSELPVARVRYRSLYEAVFSIAKETMDGDTHKLRISIEKELAGYENLPITRLMQDSAPV